MNKFSMICRSLQTTNILFEWKPSTHKGVIGLRSEEHTSELQSRSDLVCRLLLEKKKKNKYLLVDDTIAHSAHHSSPYATRSVNVNNAIYPNTDSTIHRTIAAIVQRTLDVSTARAMC